MPGGFGSFISPLVCWLWPVLALQQRIHNRLARGTADHQDLFTSKKAFCLVLINFISICKIPENHGILMIQQQCLQMMSLDKRMV